MATITDEVAEERLKTFGRCYTIDDVVRLRGQDKEQTPILGIPRTKDDPADYEYFTGAQLDCMVNEACRVLEKRGLPVNGKRTIALYSGSDLSFAITFFALFRLGYKVLTLSARLGPPACLSLLEKSECTTLLHGSTARIDVTLAEVVAKRPGIQIWPVLTREEFDHPDAPPQPPFTRPIEDLEAEHTQMVYICHSSGSTGLPKPLFLSPRGVLSSLVSGTGLKAFNVLPWYHIHGLISSMQAMWMRRPAHMFNSNLPQTAHNLMAALRVIRPEILHCVPYALSLIAEEPEGIELLKQCRFVTSAGAKTPDELGDRLVAAGVHFGVLFGLTEAGHIGDSINRAPGDDSWAYVRPYANIIEHIQFQHVRDGLYEWVYLKSHPALFMSNSNDPPGSYHSKDLFLPHPTIPNAWKYIAREDDTITLVTGEKILPLVMEGTIREHPLVQDALLCGNEHAVPALLLFRAQAAAAMTEDEFIGAIWPAIEQANVIADEFARITRETVASIAYGVEYPVTDKKNIIRARAYAMFASQINAIYARLEGGSQTTSNGPQHASVHRMKGPFDVAALEALITDTFATHTGIQLPDTHADFFASGVDSLRAIQARRLFQELLDFGSYRLPANVVYDARNAANLARQFYSLLPEASKVANAPNGTNGINGTNGTNGINGNRTNGVNGNGTNGTNGIHGANGNGINGSAYPEADLESNTEAMEALLSRYSSFSTEPLRPPSDSVLLTGATGALGAHILYQLLLSPTVERVTCLVRGPHGLRRVHTSLKTRGLDLTGLRAAARKMVVLETADLSDRYLGLDAFDYASLAVDTTLVIHSAWPVHFGLSTSSFEPHIVGLHNLLQLSLQVPSRRPARVLFASSISAAFRVPPPSTGGPALVPEGPLTSLDYAAPMGYACSKLVGEHICEAAAQNGANVAVLRIGQISGDTVHGVWNDHEAIPILVNSALELKALPLLEGENDRCEWIPVDVVAASCLEIAEAMKDKHEGDKAVNGNHTARIKARYYNISPPSSVSWTKDVLPALKEAGLDFETVPLAKWLGLLRARGVALGPDAAKQLPSLKLADYYAENFSDAKAPGLRFECSRAFEDSVSLADCPRVDDSHLISKYLHAWLKNWQK